MEMKLTQRFWACCLFFACILSTSCNCRAAAEENPEPSKTTSEAKTILQEIITTQSSITDVDARLNYKVIYTKDTDREPGVWQAILKVKLPNKYYLALKKTDEVTKYICNGAVEWTIEILEDFKDASKKDLTNGRGDFSFFTDYVPLNKEKLEKKFSISAEILEVAEESKSPAYSLVTLNPLTADQKDHLKWVKLYFNNEHKIHSLQWLDANGNLYDIEVKKTTYNSNINDDTFEYTE